MFLTYISNTWLLRTTKAHTYSKKKKINPLPAPCLHASSAAGRLSLWLRLPHCAGWGQCLWAHTAQGRGIPQALSIEHWSPGERPNAATCPAQLLLGKLENRGGPLKLSRHLEKLLLQPMQREAAGPSKDPRKLHMQQGSRISLPSAITFLSSSTSSKGQTQLQYFTFLFR